MSAPETSANSRVAALPAGLILAGGRSSRMGRDKTMMPLAGRPMLLHVADRLGPQVSDLAVNTAGPAPSLDGLVSVPDTMAGFQGPLAGVLAGLRYFSRLAAAGEAATGRPRVTHMVTVAGDGPFLPLDLVDRLTEACAQGQPPAAPERPATTIAVAASLGHMHPPYALWPLSLADDLDDWLRNPDNRRIKAFIARHHSVTVSFDPEQTQNGPRDPFFNVNTPAEFDQASSMLSPP